METTTDREPPEVGALMAAHAPLYAHAFELRRIDEEIVERAEEIEALGGALPDDLQARLDAAEGSFAEKAARVALKIADLDSAATRLRAEATRVATLFDERASREEYAADRLRAYLLRWMDERGVAKAEGDYCTVSVLKGTEKIDIAPGAILAAEWLRQPPIPAPAPDKVKLLIAHRNGQPLPAGVAVVRERKLKIA